MRTLIYFAYGSNMSLPRLSSRISIIERLGAAQLPSHQLAFHKVGSDFSAKCDIVFTGQETDCVHGIAYNISLQDKTILDKIEGLGSGYDEKSVQLVLNNGDSSNAVSYYATHIDSTLKPFHWYKQHVLHGAKENSLPSAYIESIEKISSENDPDIKRNKRELSIYDEN